MHHVGIAKSEAHGVVGTEARADGDEERRWVLGEAERNDFVTQVSIVLQMAPGAMTGMDMVRAYQLSSCTWCKQRAGSSRAPGARLTRRNGASSGRSIR